MSHVTVMFVAGSDFWSRRIEWFGGGGWAHAAQILADGSVLDSQASGMWLMPDGSPVDRHARMHPLAQYYPAGVQRRPKGYLDHEARWVKLEIPCSVQQAVAWEQSLLSQIGKPYDKLAILDFVTGSLSDRNWRDQSAWICSELDAWALERAGICPSLLLPTYRVTPGDCALIAMALHGQVVASRGIKVPSLARAA